MSISSGCIEVDTVTNALYIGIPSSVNNLSKLFLTDPNINAFFDSTLSFIVTSV